LQSSITWEILAYLIASLLERSANHLCCKCLIGKKQVMLNKITAYHQLGKMVIIEIEWMWSEYCSQEWSIMHELQISWVEFVDPVSYPVLSVSWIFLPSVYYLIALRLKESVSEEQIAKFYLFLTPFLKYSLSMSLSDIVIPKDCVTLWKLHTFPLKMVL